MVPHGHMFQKNKLVCETNLFEIPLQLESIPSWKDRSFYHCTWIGIITILQDTVNAFIGDLTTLIFKLEDDTCIS